MWNSVICHGGFWLKSYIRGSAKSLCVFFYNCLQLLYAKTGSSYDNLVLQKFVDSCCHIVGSTTAATMLLVQLLPQCC